MKLRELFLRGIAEHLSPALQSALHRAGREELAVRLSRWTLTLIGPAMLLEQLQAKRDRPTAEELRAMCWAIGAKLEAMGEPVAQVFFALADGPHEGLELQDLAKRVDATIDQLVSDPDLQGSEQIVRFCGFLRSFEVVEKGGEAT